MVNHSYPYDSYYVEDEVVRKLLLGLGSALLVASIIGNGLQWSSRAMEVALSANYERLLADTQQALLWVAKANASARAELTAAKEGVGIKEALAL